MKEKWKAGNCGGTVVSDTPNVHNTDDDVEYYGGYLVAESIPVKRYIHLITAAPEMFRVLERALPIVVAEASQRDEANRKNLGGYWSEMRELANAITAALYFAQWGVKPEPQDDHPKILAQREADGLCEHGYGFVEYCPDCKALAFENLINSAEIAAEMWDSNSASADPEEVHALLVDAVTAAKKFRGGK